MPRTSPNKAPPKPQAGTRVGNGKAILPGVDGRSVDMRRINEIFTRLERDMGGDLPEAKSIIAKRSANLAALCERIEAAMVNGDSDIDIGAYTTTINSLRRLLVDIGLERKARDITPTLSQYLAQKQGEAA
ncbi:MAG: hypothetical protein E5X59_20640 [Mesorhizobium sp.]|nr:MAG: hypothetical protein E5X59_20640 [Mesorhizobium sp.]